MKRFIGMILTLAVCVCLCCVTANAAGPTADITGPETVRAGNTITVTFSVNGSGIYGMSGSLSYDESLLTLNDTTVKISSPWKVEFNGKNFLAYDDSGENPINKNTSVFSLTFKVKSDVSTGTQIKVFCKDLKTSDGSKDTNISDASYTRTIARPLSSDNKLKSLSVGNATISPNFSPDTTFYTARVEYEVSKLDITAMANHSGAKVSISNPTLAVNDTTTVKVTVTAENGSTKTYTISVSRPQDPNYVKADNNNLESITVEGFYLSPLFTPENTQYVIWLPFEVETVKVSGTSEDDKASVRVEGGEGLLPGQDNEIKVICTAENGTEKVYTVIAKRAADPNAEPTEPEETEPEETQPETTEPENTPATQKPTAPTAPTTQQPAPQQEGVYQLSLGQMLIFGILILLIGLALGILIGRMIRF